MEDKIKRCKKCKVETIHIPYMVMGKKLWLCVKCMMKEKQKAEVEDEVS